MQNMNAKYSDIFSESEVDRDLFIKRLRTAIEAMSREEFESLKKINDRVVRAFFIFAKHFGLKPGRMAQLLGIALTTYYKYAKPPTKIAPEIKLKMIENLKLWTKSDPDPVLRTHLGTDITKELAQHIIDCKYDLSLFARSLHLEPSELRSYLDETHTPTQKLKSKFANYLEKWKNNGSWVDPFFVKKSSVIDLSDKDGHNIDLTQQQSKLSDTDSDNEHDSDYVPSSDGTVSLEVLNNYMY